MWQAVGDTLPLAFGLAMSPFAIITGLVFLLGERGRSKATFFCIGWFMSILTIATVALVVVEVTEEEVADVGVSIGQLIIGVAMLAIAVIVWLRRPRGTTKESPLLRRLDTISALGAWGIGLAQGVLVIQSIPLALGAGARFGEAGLTGGTAITALVLFAVVAALGVIIPLAIVVFAGPRMLPALRAARMWIEANMVIITVIIMVLLGGFFVGQGLGVLD